MILLKDVQRKIEICLVAIIVLAITLFAINKFVFKNNSLATYSINGDIKYNVTTKNKLATDLQNQSLFIASNTDLINANFKYNYKVDKSIGYKYKYKIVSSVVSEVDDSTLSKKEVYKKDNVLKQIDFKDPDIDGFNIDEEVSLKFDDYNKLATDFDETVNIAIISKLKVTLYVYVNYDNGKKDEFKYYITLPLEKPTFSIRKSGSGDKGTIITDEIDTVRLSINIGIISFIVVLFGIIIYQISRFYRYKKTHYSEFKYRKILNDYEGIVVPINAIPKDNNMVTVKVLYFKNIVDIQKEMHLPILCYKSDNVIIYMIIHNKLAYIYFLNDNKEKI